MMRSPLPILRSLAAVLALAAAATAQADDDSEREALARIEHELQQLQRLVAEAQQNADPSARVRFRYDWLSRDLELVRRGVVEHLDAPRQPRPVPPLAGDYRR